MTSRIEETYPIVLIPDKIISAIENDIPIENIIKDINLEPPKIIEPIKKVYPPSEYNYSEQKEIYYQSNDTIYHLSIALILSIIIGIFAAPEILPLMIIFISPFFIINFVFNLKSKKITIKNKKSIEEIELLNREYLKKKLEIEAKNKLIEIKNASLQKLFNEKLDQMISEYRRNYFVRQLAPDKESEAVRNQEKIIRGKYEIMFLERLLNHFGRKIRMDTTPNTYKKYYYPDFTYICDRTNLHIDIEIDEPYSLIDKMPIHYIGSRDEARNEYFLSYNWVVIRFSEKQVNQDIDGCINLIENVVNAILNKKTMFDNPLQLQSRWSYEEALLMASNNERNFY